MAFRICQTKKPALPVKRFATFSKEEVDSKRYNAVPVSAPKANTKAAKALESYLVETGGKPLAELVAASELAEVLSSYYFAARTVDGHEYRCSSLENFRQGLNRHIKQHMKADMDIIKVPAYREANLSFKAAMTELKKKGLGSVRHYPNIDKSDLVKLYNSTYLSTSTASGLYRKVQFDIRYYFCRRGGENMVDMTKETFSVQTDPDSGLKVRR